MEQHREELALLDTLETGRSLKNYYYDSIPKAIEALRWFSESIDKYYDHAITPRKNEFATITKEPLGVVGLITPWNDPLVVDVWKFAPALLMGNSVILKPAEQSSFSILKVAQLALEAGVPTGVFNVVPGYGHIAIFDDPIARKAQFIPCWSMDIGDEANLDIEQIESETTSVDYSSQDVKDFVKALEEDEGKVKLVKDHYKG